MIGVEVLDGFDVEEDAVRRRDEEGLKCNDEEVIISVYRDKKYFVQKYVRSK